jgi:multisubunit Na+/H+ antiporter MnhB subunit
MEPPTRIKLYGLFTITKGGYIAQLVVMGVLLVMLLIAWGKIPSEAELHKYNFSPEQLLIMGYLRWIPWIVLGFALLIATEAFFVFRRFARAEATRRAEQPPKTPHP